MKETSDLYRYTGSIQQLAYARRICYDEGRARGLHAVEVCNGPMRFVIMLDKCMDISELSWRGEQMTFLSKPGLNGRNPFDTNGAEAQRSIMGGLFFTCGYENICAPYEDSETVRRYPMHGRMRTSPAEHVSVSARWEDGRYVLRISGDIREAELFGENLLLHRTITTVYGSASIEICDEIRNEAFRDEPLLLMYHSSTRAAASCCRPIRFNRATRFPRQILTAGASWIRLRTMRRNMSICIRSAVIRTEARLPRSIIKTAVLRFSFASIRLNFRISASGNPRPAAIM